MTSEENQEKTQRGKGALYALKMRRLSNTHVKLLSLLLSAIYGMTKQEITHMMNQTASAECLQNGGCFISGRLSELLRLGFVRMQNAKVDLMDANTMTYRHAEKPVWEITQKGRDFLARVREGQPETYEIG